MKNEGENDAVDQYRRWFEADCIAQFARKRPSDFFRSEVELLGRIDPSQISSILDIGCAAGRLIEYLRTVFPEFSYTGIDIVPAQIDMARQAYPDARFHSGNALEFQWDHTYDLVIATGVMQHEPRYRALLDRMCALAARYLIFDVKLARIDDDIADLNQSHCGSPENPLHYIILSPRRLISHLKNIPDVDAIEFLGYRTPLNSRTIVPTEIQSVWSCGVLVRKGAGRGAPPAFRIDIEDLDISA